MRSFGGFGRWRSVFRGAGHHAGVRAGSVSGSSPTLPWPISRVLANVIVRTRADALSGVYWLRALALLHVRAILCARSSDSQEPGSAYKQRTHADGFDAKHIRKLTTAQ